MYQGFKKATQCRLLEPLVKINIYCSTMVNEEEAFVDVVEIESEETPNWKQKQCKGKTRKWGDEEMDLLIDLLEQNGCLWDEPKFLL